MDALKLENLSKTYSGRTVLTCSSLSLPAGQVHALIGANGSGKSTLLKLICGIEKPDKLKNGNRPVIDTDGAEIAYMPQKNHPFAMSVRRNVLAASRGSSSDKAMAQQMLDGLGLSALAGQPARRLSGGETAKMVLARTLLCSAGVVLLDEPTAAMDMESTLQAELLIRDAAAAEGRTVVIITHSIAQAARIADTVTFLKEGDIIESGPAAIVLNTPASEETKAFLNFFGQ